MEHLEHWNNAMCFTGREISLLIMGVDPSRRDSDNVNPKHLLGQLRSSYIAALWRVRQELGLDVGMRSYDTELVESELPGNSLNSLALLQAHAGWVEEGMEEQLEGWLKHERSAFEFQEFSRSEVVRWLAANNFFSKYQFDIQKVDSTSSGATTSSTSAMGSATDPTDLPPELDAASIAFRAVSNGYGDQGATFRNRLVAYFKVNYPKLSNETVQRLATVANADKSTGRKKSA